MKSEQVDAQAPVCRRKNLRKKPVPPQACGGGRQKLASSTFAAVRAGEEPQRDKDAVPADQNAFGGHRAGRRV